MSILDIVCVPDPVLKETARPVDKVDDAIRRQMKDMLETMFDAPGIGLAANQVGMLNRVIVCALPEDCWAFGANENGALRIDADRKEWGEPVPLMMANPEILWQSEERSVYEEGCLSIPGQLADVVRPAHIRVRYLDENNEIREREASGLHAHCIQHEIDHLNGRLFIDYLSNLRRNMILRKLKKRG